MRIEQLCPACAAKAQEQDALIKRLEGLLKARRETTLEQDVQKAEESWK